MLVGTEEKKSWVRRKRLCLVIPTLNEQENITNLLARIQELESRLPVDLTILVVDDNSADGTAEAVMQAMGASEHVELIRRPGPAGIGSAYLEGFEHGLKLGCDYLGEMDADLQHPPEALIKMSETSENGTDIVLASRYVEGGASFGWSLSRRFISWGANLLSKIFIRSPVADSTSGFRILSARAIRGLLEFELSSKGYAFQVESIYIYKKLAMSFAEIPYIFEHRKVGKTKLRGREMLHFAYVVIKVGIFGVKKKSPHSIQDYAS